MKIETKIVNGLERLSEALKSLLWEQAKTHGISPIQIQILLFVFNHRTDLCNISYLAKEFNVTKATVSDAVKTLFKKGLLEKDFSPTDNRRYNLIITPTGTALVNQISDYALPVSEELSSFDKLTLADIFDIISKLIFQLNQRGIIQIQRTCFKCKYYSGDKINRHYCNLMKSNLKKQDIRLDCAEFEKMA